MLFRQRKRSASGRMFTAKQRNLGSKHTFSIQTNNEWKIWVPFFGIKYSTTCIDLRNLLSSRPETSILKPLYISSNAHTVWSGFISEFPGVSQSDLIQIWTVDFITFFNWFGNKSIEVKRNDFTYVCEAGFFSSILAHWFSAFSFTTRINHFSGLFFQMEFLHMTYQW